MDRRPNSKIENQSQNQQTDTFSLPEEIDAPIEGVHKEGHAFINALLLSYRFGLNAFRPMTPHHEDWMILFVIMVNESQGRATVTKNIVELTGRAYGTVRASLQRFEKLGYIEPNQRIGRSELYVPTAYLKQLINRSAEAFWPDIENLVPDRD